MNRETCPTCGQPDNCGDCNHFGTEHYRDDSLTEYTVHIEHGIRVRHDAQARFTVTSGRSVLEDRLTGIESIDGAITAASITYNALSYSGGVSWWNPATGKPLPRAPKVRLRVRPQDMLTGEQECGCQECEKERYDQRTAMLYRQDARP